MENISEKMAKEGKPFPKKEPVIDIEKSTFLFYSIFSKPFDIIKQLARDHTFDGKMVLFVTSDFAPINSLFKIN